MDERQLETLLRETLHEETRHQRQAVQGLEERVLATLSARRSRQAQASAAPPRWRLGLAFAATAVAFLALGWFLGGQVGLLQPSLTTGQGVMFVVAYPEARSVAVRGDFTGWEEQPLKLLDPRRGIWGLQLDLPPGRYEYTFVVNGVKEVLDPRADEVVWTFNGERNSLIYVNQRGDHT